MKKTVLVILISSLFLLSACSLTRKGAPAGITDANNLGFSSLSSPQDQAILSRALTKDDNLVGKDFGPQTGALAKRSFYFDFNQFTVRPDDVPYLQLQAKYLINHPKANALLEGNTDIRGSREYNITLGQKRADAVKSILRMQGVNAKQLCTVSYGAERPVALGNTDADYQLNRRVDVVYVDSCQNRRK